MPAHNDGADARLEIPEECYRVKNEFYERPPKTVIEEIKKFVAETGKPHLWRGHTHTKPSADAVPEYLDEFDLPAKLVKYKHFAPCPCCRPEHGKYGLNGKIGWFPTEGVIRLMGPDCFATLNKDAHETAKEELRKRKIRARDIAYLIDHQDRLLKALRALTIAHDVARAIDKFADDLQSTLYESLDVNLWDQVRTGNLQVWEKFSEYNPRTGEFQERQQLRDHVSVRGHLMLNPNLSGYGFRVRQLLDGFRVIEQDGWHDRIMTMQDIDRYKLAQLISNIIRRGRSRLAEMRELQRFVATENIATIRAWGVRPDSPKPIIIERNGPVISIGRSHAAKFRVKIPIHLEDQLLDIDVPIVSELALDPASALAA